MTALIYNKRLYIDSENSIDVHFFKNNGLLDTITSGQIVLKGVQIGFWLDTRSSEPYLRVYYKPSEKEYVSYVIELIKTKCNFGGYRFWFICPLEVNGNMCGKRVGVLYF